jgi:osmotically-inducible protein OsmY
MTTRSKDSISGGLEHNRIVARFLAFLLLVGLVGGGVYYWKFHPGRGPREDLGEVGRSLRDAATTAAVKTALSLHRSLKVHAIQVDTEDGVVTLRGEVASGTLKEEAGEVAAAVPDVRQVVNHLDVAGGAPASPAGRTLGESLDDEALEMKVRLAFSLRRELKGTRIEVEAYQRRVALSGEVATPEQRELAVAVARETDGVTDVTERLRVLDTSSYSRAVDVEKALADNRNLAPYRLTVREEGGRLVISGRVRTGAERDLAELLAREAARGPVDSRIEVRP